MAIEVFWASGSPFAWRVLLALEVKGLPYEGKLLQFSSGDLRKPEYLAINPRGQVPALRDGEVVVYESMAILAYLDRAYPEPPLFGRSAAEAARVWQAALECVVYLDGVADRFILPLYFGRTAEKEKSDEVRAALAPIAAELARLEASLHGRAHLALDALSAADLVVYPMVRSLLRAAEKPAAAAFDHRITPFAERYPRLAAWMGRIEALPGYDRSFPPHWRAG
jgi:glutathione S-transferase